MKLTQEFKQTLDFLDKELTTLYPEYLTIKDQIYEEKISGVRINVLNIREPNLKLIFEILIWDDDFYLIDVYGEEDRQDLAPQMMEAYEEKKSVMYKMNIAEYLTTKLLKFNEVTK